MTTHDNTPDQGDDLLDINLARAVKNLDPQIEPHRDLWPGIERRIASLPQRDRDNFMHRMMPYGMAASLLIAVSALVLTLYPPNPIETVQYASLADSVRQVQSDFVAVRNPTFQRFEQANKELDPETIALLYRNMEIIEKARKEIELALMANPENEQLLGMLLRVHEQELGLLNQTYINPSSSL